MTSLDRLADDEADGERLDVALTAWTGEPRSRVQRWLADGAVLVDGEPAVKSHRLRAGERVVLRPASAQPLPAPPAVPVRYEDEHLAIVAKPAGLVVHPGAGVRPEATLVDALRRAGMPLAMGPEPERPGIVHRLDRGTSGLLVVAKSEQAHAGLLHLFAEHAIERAYWALTQGVPDQPRATIDAPITRHPTHRTRFVTDPAGRPAVSHYDVLEAFDEVAAVEVRLETGRTHQVRVHLAAVGHPVVGDRLYGAATGLAERLGLARPALHARLLAFEHPVTRVPVRCVEDLPTDLAGALSTLRGER